VPHKLRFHLALRSNNPPKQQLPAGTGKKHQELASVDTGSLRETQFALAHNAGRFPLFDKPTRCASPEPVS
jgi:hypothetical protein